MSSSGDTPRILYIAEECAFNVANGSNVRCLNVLCALKQIGRVEVVTVSDPVNPEPVSVADPEINIAYSVETKMRSNQGLVAKLRWTCDPTTDYPRGYGVRDEALRRVIRTVKEFDLIWFFKLRCAELFPNLAWPNSVLDIDDVLSRYERAALHAGGSLSERLLALRRMVTWRRREKLLSTRFGVLAVCSEEDKRYLTRLGVDAPVYVIPNGFDKPRQEPARRPTTPPRIGFIGFLSYFPNRQGINWFVEKCWPHIKREIPEARLRLVGAGTDGPLKPSGPDVDGLGWLTDPADEIQTWSAMAVPIFVGAGTRVKIAYGFSQKCPIVSTSLGAHGYGVMNERELYLADTPEAFSQACIRTIREPQKAGEVAERAWREFLEMWTWDAVRPRVWAAATECLRRNSQSQRAVPGMQAAANRVARPQVPESNT